MTDLTMYRETVDKIHIVVHSDKKPSNDDWQTMLSTLEKDVPGGRVVGILVFLATAGHPNPLQRQNASQLWKRIPMPPMAVVTKLPLARALASAFNLVLPTRAAVFAHDEVDAALRHVRVEDAQKTMLAIRRLHFHAGVGIL